MALTFPLSNWNILLTDTVMQVTGGYGCRGIRWNDDKNVIQGAVEAAYMELQRRQVLQLLGSVGTVGWDSTSDVPRPQSAALSSEAPTCGYGGVVNPSGSGDVNGDGHIDIRDIVTIGRYWLSDQGSDRYETDADLNDDGTVDIEDATIVGQNWQESAGYGLTPYGCPEE
jgi:hypothetical protein